MSIDSNGIPVPLLWMSFNEKPPVSVDFKKPSAGSRNEAKSNSVDNSNPTERTENKSIAPRTTRSKSKMMETPVVELSQKRRKLSRNQSQEFVKLEKDLSLKPHTECQEEFVLTEKHERHSSDSKSKMKVEVGSKMDDVTDPVPCALPSKNRTKNLQPDCSKRLEHDDRPSSGKAYDSTENDSERPSGVPEGETSKPTIDAPRRLVLNRELRSIFKESWKKEDPKNMIELDPPEYDPLLPPLTRSQIHVLDHLSRSAPKPELASDDLEKEVDVGIRKRGRKRKRASPSTENVGLEFEKEQQEDRFEQPSEGKYQENNDDDIQEKQPKLGEKGELFS
jgi:hypothetical protein